LLELTFVTIVSHGYIHWQGRMSLLLCCWLMGGFMVFLFQDPLELVCARVRAVFLHQIMMWKYVQVMRLCMT
jgi:hypothetical protein